MPRLSQKETHESLEGEMSTDLIYEDLDPVPDDPKPQLRATVNRSNPMNWKVAA